MFSHQKQIRDSLLRDDLRRLGSRFYGLTPRDFDLSVEEFTPEHRRFIETYEWLGTVGFGHKQVFTARYLGELGGVVIITEPYQYGRHVRALPAKSDALISRGACAGWTPKNLGSRLVMYACRWMVAHTLKRVFVAYTDARAGEIGVIYQACNFSYLGQVSGSKLFRMVDGSVRGAQWFRRTASITRVWKDVGIATDSSWFKPSGFLNRANVPLDKLKLAEKVLRSEVIEELSAVRKGKYCLILGRGKAQTRQLRQNALFLARPYPCKA